MRKLVLAVLVIVMFTTPCLAEPEPEGLFSIEGTLWLARGLEFEEAEGYKVYFGFAYDLTFLCLGGGNDCGLYGLYVELPMGNIHFLSVFNPFFGSAPGFLLPTLRVGLLIYYNFQIILMSKVSDNWIPTSEYMILSDLLDEGKNRIRKGGCL